MSAPHRFTCAGCKQVLKVAEPPASEPIRCPAEACGRLVWARGERELELVTNSAPTILNRFGRDCRRLLYAGEELLVGPPETLDAIAERLEEDPPAYGLELVERVRELVQELGRGAILQPGRALVIAAGARRAQ
jgi:hypothetical protein